MDQEQGGNNQTKKPRKKPVRSRYQFPSYDLGVARQIAEKVEYEGAGQLTRATLAMSIRASVKSSGFRLKIYAARQFQLLTKEGEYLATTPLAKAIFKPTTEEERRKKMMEAFMAIPLFNAVATRFRGQPLPPSQTFRNILEREFGVEHNRVSEAERVLTDSAREAGLISQSGDRTYLSIEIMQPTSSPQTIGVPSVPLAAQSTMDSSPSKDKSQQYGGLLTVSEEDLADFSNEEFDEIWQALGKIVRVRGKRQREEENNIEINKDFVEDDEEIG